MTEKKMDVSTLVCPGNPACQNDFHTKAVQAVENLRYREGPPGNWRLYPLNLGGKKGEVHDKQIACVVAVIGKDEWGLLNGLRAADILSADDFFARLSECVAQKTMCVQVASVTHVRVREKAKNLC